MVDLTEFFNKCCIRIDRKKALILAKKRFEDISENKIKIEYEVWRKSYVENL